MPAPLRHLVLVTGDQLNPDAAAFDGFDAAMDQVWMAELDEEATQPPSHPFRLVLFFAAMRHFRDALRERGVTVHYRELPATPRSPPPESVGFAAALAGDLPTLRPQRLIVTHPGDHRVLTLLRDAARAHGLPLDVRDDRHFLCTTAAFDDWADARKTLVMEHFYRRQRQEHRVLLTHDGGPVGGRWNYDADNRAAFGKRGPGAVPRPRPFPPDALTRAVIDLVQTRYPDHPGSCAAFDLPVTPAQARAALDDFIEHRLPLFGRFEDAMWDAEPFLYHSRLSAALNLHLLDPRACLAAAVDAHARGHAPLESGEGFVRQILGWREFVRGVYWNQMPRYATLNALDAQGDVPPFFWTAQTDMNCVRHAVGQLQQYAYTHHIHRLMVLGLYALLAGVHPFRFHQWHLALYADAVDWVSLPNALGMSQFGDGGIVGTKPYCATGKYIDRMSNYCAGCRYRPDQATGADACPFTTLYWDFLARHRTRFARNPRMVMQVKNLDRKPPADLRAIRRHADTLRA